MIAAELTVDAVSAALHAHVLGNPAAEIGDAVAVRLIEQTDWLQRPAFRAFIEYAELGREHSEMTGNRPVAWVRWADALAALDRGSLHADSASCRVLRIAASLAKGVPVDLREVASGLGAHHSALVLRALRHKMAAGRREGVVAEPGC